MSIKVSIIIPCYNQGHFLQDTISTLKGINGHPFEIIIVNDGSTDDFTNLYTKQLHDEGYNVIFQKNKGLANARNTAIGASRGEYILPLDSDNFLLEPYLNEGVDILDERRDISVVYGDATIFGDRDEEWIVGEYNLQRLMLYNYIDACALIRKSVLLEVGMYDEVNKLYGLEDWDLWLRISFRNYAFKYINKKCFCYRVHSAAMSKGKITQYENVNKVEQVINAKYPLQMGHEWITKNFVSRFKKSPFQMLVKVILISYFPNLYSKLLIKNKIRNGI